MLPIQLPKKLETLEKQVSNNEKKETIKKSIKLKVKGRPNEIAPWSDALRKTYK